METRRAYFRLLQGPLAFIAVLVLVGLACGTGGGPYEENFENIGNWGSGSDQDAEGDVNNGRYELLVKAEAGIFWSTAGENFSDGIYEVEATPLSGPIDNGYGMRFRVDTDDDSFYVFEVSADGFVWIGRCSNGCEEVEALINDGWFESDAVNQGLNSTNTLRVRAEGANLIFFVNGQEVGRVTDTTYDEGDIAVMAESLGAGDVLVAFDNFTVTALDE